MHALHVVGARPNFMKAAPVVRALDERGAIQTIVHTGQHYDINMSDVFFAQLGMPEPCVNLGVGSGTHAWQTAGIMVGFESVVLKHRPDIVLVYGDVNSTMAASLICSKLGVKVGHVEAGLRSFDRTMPEEINRLIADQLADLLFTPSEDGDANLQREGIAAEKVFRVGNVMIDSLVRVLPLARELKWEGLSERYTVVTLHRPSNVDDPVRLKKILHSLREISERLEVVFPVHPRTRLRIDELKLPPSALRLTNPLPYIEFLALVCGATAVLTDSGGLQEETTFLRIPCLTLRANTERPVTVSLGTNVLVGTDAQKLDLELNAILDGRGKQGLVPPLWDGNAAPRIADVVLRY